MMNKEKLAIVVQILFEYCVDPKWLIRHKVSPSISSMKKTALEFPTKHYVAMIKDMLDSDDPKDSLSDLCDYIKYLPLDMVLSSIEGLEDTPKVSFTYEEMCQARIKSMFLVEQYVKDKFFYLGALKSEISNALNVFCERFAGFRVEEKEKKRNKKKDENIELEKTYSTFKSTLSSIVKIIRDSMASLRYFDSDNMKSTNVGIAAKFMEKVDRVIDYLRVFEQYYRNAYPDISYFDRMILAFVTYHVVNDKEQDLIDLYGFDEQDVKKFIQKKQYREDNDVTEDGRDMKRFDSTNYYAVDKMFSKFSIPYLLVSETLDPTSDLYPKKYKNRARGFLFRHYMIRYMTANSLTHFTRERYDATKQHVEASIKNLKTLGQKRYTTSIKGFGKEKDQAFIPTNESGMKYLNFESTNAQVRGRISVPVLDGLNYIDDPEVFAAVMRYSAAVEEAKRRNPEMRGMELAVHNLLSTMGPSQIGEEIRKSQIALNPPIEGKFLVVANEVEDVEAEESKPQRKPKKSLKALPRKRD